MPHIKLQIGQVISASTKVIDKVLAGGFKTDNLILGHLAQYAHDLYFPKIPEAPRYSLFDRRICGTYHDDKCATWYTDKNGNNVISATHTISADELAFWDSELAAGRDVIIHSFEQVFDSLTQFVYKGALSFKLLREKNIIIERGRASGKPMFYRANAYRQCLLDDRSARSSEQLIVAALTVQ